MRTLRTTISAEVGTFEELHPDDQELLLAAIEAAGNSQSPYSEYAVGAAARAETGEIIIGVNVENCAYLVDHAEQVALATMVTMLGPGTKVASIAIAGGPHGALNGKPVVTGPGPNVFEELPAPACAWCRQKIWENCHRDPAVRLIGMMSNGEVFVTTMGDAYPMPFGPNDLGVEYE